MKILARSSSFLAKTLAATFVLGGLFACAASTDPAAEGDDDEMDSEDGPMSGDEDQYASTSEAMTGAGPCSGQAIDRAVRCAKAKGARVLSYYRSAAEQQRVRRENGCRNKCTGMQGCVRPTANCNSSPHTRCRAVDLVADGAPVSRAELKKCGLAKTSLPHANHYDYVGN